MSRIAILVGILTVVGKAPAQPALPVADNTVLARHLEVMYVVQKEFPELPADPQTKLGAMLDALSTNSSGFADPPPFRLNFEVNKAAFKADKVDDALDTAFVSEKPLPTMRDVPLEQYLRKILERIPASSGATYLY